MTLAAPTSLMDILRTLERLPTDQSGRLVFGEPERGAIYLERGRVCWVAATTLRRRLRDLLSTSAKIPADELARVFARCKAEGRLLGESLVADGWLSAAELGGVLRRHSAESLVALCDLDAPAQWRPHKGGFQPQQSFSPIELLLEVAALLEPARVVEGQAHLASTRGLFDRGAAFAVGDRPTALVPVAVEGATTLAQVDELRQWATTLAGAAHEYGRAPTLVLGASPGEETLVAWWHEGLLIAVAGRDQASVTRIASAMMAPTPSPRRP